MLALNLNREMGFANPSRRRRRKRVGSEGRGEEGGRKKRRKLWRSKDRERWAVKRQQEEAQCRRGQARSPPHACSSLCGVEARSMCFSGCWQSALLLPSPGFFSHQVHSTSLMPITWTEPKKLVRKDCPRLLHHRPPFPSDTHKICEKYAAVSTRICLKFLMFCTFLMQHLGFVRISRIFSLTCGYFQSPELIVDGITRNISAFQCKRNLLSTCVNNGYG